MVLSSVEKINTASSELDYLTCGQCFRGFPLQMITTFISHKKLDCNDQTVQYSASNHTDIPDLQCSSCPEVFMTAWGILNHVQSAHNIQIFLARTTYFKQSETTSDAAEPIIVSENATRDSTMTASCKNGQLSVNNCMNALLEKNATVQQSAVIDREMNDKQLSVPEIVDHVLCPTPCNTSNIRSGSGITRQTSVLDQRLQSVITSVSGKTETRHSHHLKDMIDEDRDNSQSKLAVTNTNAIDLPVIKSPSDQVLLPKDSSMDRTEITLNPTCPKQHPAKIQNSSPASVYRSSENVKSLTDLTPSEQKVNRISCCDSQKCGITVIPVTHENLKECCNAVVPKKRKRHFETKHIPWASRFGKRRGSITTFESKSTSAGTIYIDIQPDTGQISNSVIENRTISSGSSDAVRSSTGVMDIQESDPVSSVISRSVILKPGAVFSMPFPCSISSQNAAQKHFQLTANTSGTPSALLVPEVIHQQDGTRIIMSHSDSSMHSSVQSATSSKMESSSPITSSDSCQGNANLSSQIFSKCYGQNVTISSESLSDTFHDGDVKGFMRKRRYPTSRPYKCEQCDNAFNQRIHLKKHMSKHTGIKPYKCQQCDYSTVERSHLKVHIRIHTGEKPFKCTNCEYATAQNSTLKIHLKRHHGGKMFQCQHCDKQFAQIDLLQNHKTEHQQPLLQADQSAANQNFAHVQNIDKLAVEPDSPKSQSVCHVSEVLVPAQESQISSNSSNFAPIESLVKPDDSHISQDTQQANDIPDDAKMSVTSISIDNESNTEKIEDSSNEKT